MRVLLVEDEPKVASFIARALREDAYAVDMVDRGETALRHVQEVTYDAILLDIRLPGITGIEVCQKLRHWGMEVPILMLTARGLLQQRVEGLDAGADDYLTKPFEVAELLARLRAILRRASSQGKGTLSFADLSLDRHGRRALRGQSVIPLTLKELALLELLLLRAPDAVTRSEIIEHVWDSRFEGSTNLIEVYVMALRQKLEAGGKPRLIQTVRGIGYRLGTME